MEPPEAYKGQNDHNAFEKWLITLLAMMSLSNMGGHLQDRNRLLLAGNHMSEPAREWFIEQVERPMLMQGVH